MKQRYYLKPLLRAVPIVACMVALPAFAGFKNNGDGTILDEDTGLIWDQCSFGQPFTGTTCTGSATALTWNYVAVAAADNTTCATTPPVSALQASVCANVTMHRNQNDWRVPNKNELESLVNLEATAAPYIATAFFPNTSTAAAYWSSTPVAFTAPATLGGIQAWTVHFNTGAVAGAVTDTSAPVLRLVRGGHGSTAAANTDEFLKSAALDSFPVVRTRITAPGAVGPPDTRTGTIVGGDISANATPAVNSVPYANFAINAQPIFAVNALLGGSVASVTGCGGSLSVNSYQTSALGAGCTIVATFANNLQAQTIGAIVFNPSTPMPLGSNTTTVTATATSGLAVTFSSSTPAICSIAGNVVTSISPGNCIIAANQVGDATRSAAPTVTGTIMSGDIKLNGRCGTSDGGIFTSAPTQNLCDAGNPSAVTGTGPWTWSCDSPNGGTNASCRANTVSYTVTGVAGSNGNITPSSQSVLGGQTTNLVVTANSGYRIDSVTGCGGTLNAATGVYTTGAITASCTVNATFISLTAPITITATAGAGGTITPGTRTVTPGETTTFTVAPNAGFSVDKVEGCGGTLAGNVYTTAAINATCTVTASFKVQTIKVTSTAGFGGTITPSGEQSVSKDQVLTFTVTPNAGYATNAVFGCGGTLAGNVYTTGPITADCTVSANFNSTVVGEFRPLVFNGDYNGDGKADIIWHNVSTGEAYGILLNSFVITEQDFFYTEPNTSWTIAQNANLVGGTNKKSSLLWWNNVNGQLYNMEMNGLTRGVGTDIYQDTNTSWQVVAVGDLNGDGKDDLVWWNSADGRVYGMLMNGTTIATQGLFWVEPNLQWRIIAARDFNGDGKADILWRNIQTGEVYLMTMNGLTITAGNMIYHDPNLNWQIAAVGDINGDKKADIVWWNRATGLVYGMLMNGTTITQGAAFYQEPDVANWRIVSSGDYNGDGKTDLLWRNSQTGDVYELQLNGLAKLAGQVIYNEARPAWRIRSDANGGAAADVDFGLPTATRSLAGAQHDAPLGEGELLNEVQPLEGQPLNIGNLPK